MIPQQAVAPNEAPHLRSRYRWDPLLLPLLAFALYWAMAQSSVHHRDTHFLLSMARQGHFEHPTHLLVLFVPVAVARALATFGIEALASVRITIAACGAIGIACLHRAAWTLGRSAALARTVALATAVTPGFFYFATMIELQGLTLPWIGLATWMFARVAVNPTRLAATLAGLAGGLAAAVHSTGHLLPLLFGILGICGWTHWRGWRTGAVTAAIIALSHAAMFAAIVVLVGGRWQAAGPGSMGFVLLGLGLYDGVVLLRIVLEEWLLPFLPWSVMAPILAWRIGARRELIGLLGCTAVLLGATYLMIGRQPGSWEFGAYVLPLAMPASWLALRGAPSAAARILIAIALSCSVITVVLHARNHPASAQFASDARQLSQSRPLVILSGDRFELDSIYLYGPELAVVDLAPDLPRAIGPDAVYTLAQQLVDMVVRSAVTERRTVVFPQRTWQALGQAGDGAWERMVNEYLPAHYQIEPVAFGTFTGQAVTAR